MKGDEICAKRSNHATDNIWYLCSCGLDLQFSGHGDLALPAHFRVTAYGLQLKPDIAELRTNTHARRTKSKTVTNGTRDKEKEKRTMQMAKRQARRINVPRFKSSTTCSCAISRFAFAPALKHFLAPPANQETEAES